MGVVPAAAVEHQGVLVVGAADFVDLADIDGVVAVGVGADYGAVEEDGGVVEDGEAVLGVGEGVVDAAGAVLGFFGEVGADGFLLFAEEVDAEALAGFEVAVGVGAVGDADEDDGWFEADGGEGVGGDGRLK